jgi:hypothetical protein
MASPILRDTIKKLKDRRTLLQRQIKGPLAELKQIEEDLAALGAETKKPKKPAAPRGATEAAILRAIRNGATTPDEITTKTGIAGATVVRTVTLATTKTKRIVNGPNGLTLTKAGRERMTQLEAAARLDG